MGVYTFYWFVNFIIGRLKIRSNIIVVSCKKDIVQVVQDVVEQLGRSLQY